MQRLNAVRFQYRGNLVSDADDGAVGVFRAQRVRLVVFPACLLRVGLGRVRMYDQNLRPLSGKIQRGRAGQQRLLVHGIGAGPCDRDGVRLLRRKCERGCALRIVRLPVRRPRQLLPRLRLRGVPIPDHPHRPDAQLLRSGRGRLVRLCLCRRDAFRHPRIRAGRADQPQQHRKHQQEKAKITQLSFVHGIPPALSYAEAAWNRHAEWPDPAKFFRVRRDFFTFLIEFTKRFVYNNFNF